jgi:hypothetical protein
VEAAMTGCCVENRAIAVAGRFLGRSPRRSGAAVNTLPGQGRFLALMFGIFLDQRPKGRLVGNITRMAVEVWSRPFD